MQLQLTDLQTPACALYTFRRKKRSLKTSGHAPWKLLDSERHQNAVHQRVGRDSLCRDGGNV